MKFVRVNDTRQVVDYLTETLEKQLGKGRVLWLVPGGSSIGIAAEVSKRLAGRDLSGLTVSLTDERYGYVGHKDSNWRQLQEQDFALPGARLQPVLTGADMTVTAQRYGDNLETFLGGCDYRLGFFGIGADGHTAGILPHSPALGVEGMAAAYDAGNFKRITVTARAIKRLDEAVVYAAGQEKRPVLRQLQQENLPIEQQPAQLLKSVPELTIFNDSVGDEK